jgi:hypothetical protein
MKILRYNELDITGVQAAYEKVVDQLQRDDFYSAEVKKLTGTPYYRAKLDYANRALFKIVAYQGEKYVLMLEIIRQHAYDKSRFLNGAVVDEAKLSAVSTLEQLTAQTTETLPYLNPRSAHFHVLDKIISFDEKQDDIFYFPSPLILIGSAGSGKTLLTLEKMKACAGDVLYITHSPFLVHNARQLYYANQYANDDQAIEFLSYREFLETWRVPAGREMDFYAFAAWLGHHHRTRAVRDAHKLYEEFKGVITGNAVEQRYLSREDYLHLGVKQSIYAPEERAAVYDLFEKYLVFLTEKNCYDSNMLSFDYLALCQPKYDFIVADEVQDFTMAQLALILKSLKQGQQFILCGDSNQIVHPNFFSWSKIKSLFYQQTTETRSTSCGY